MSEIFGKCPYHLACNPKPNVAYASVRGSPNKLTLTRTKLDSESLNAKALRGYEEPKVTCPSGLWAKLACILNWPGMPSKD